MTSKRDLAAEIDALGRGLKALQIHRKSIDASKARLERKVETIAEQIDGGPTKIEATTICSMRKEWEFGLSSVGILPRLEAVEEYIRLASLPRRASTKLSLWNRIRYVVGARVAPLLDK